MFMLDKAIQIMLLALAMKFHKQVLQAAWLS